MQFPDECQNTSLDGSCLALGCPASCCIESDDGFVSCETQDSNICENVTKGIVDEEPCESACKGACCIDGELTEGSPTTQAECDALGGCWYGIGSTQCGEGFCRAPFDGDCCEHVVSSAASLTFTGPRKRRCPELDGCGFEVTVSVTTGQPVYVHGNQFGNPYEACTEVATFVTCNDTFRVTPAPCTGNLDKLDIEVCWDDGSGPELLRFHCCDGTYLLGNCECDCDTTLLYEGAGCTSAAALQMNGEAIIEANGTGPLVLTANITHAGSCDRKLTLTGTNTDKNEIAGVIANGPLNTDVEKLGLGKWAISSASSYAGRLRILQGTFVAAANVPSSGSSPFGASTTLLPETFATLLVEGGLTVSRGLSLASGVLGSIGAGSATWASGANINVGGGIRLVADTAGDITFSNSWGNASGPVDWTIGAIGSEGIVILDSEIPEASSLTLYRGTTRLVGGLNDLILPTTPVVVDSSTLDVDISSQSLDSLTVNSQLTFDGDGELIVEDLTGAGWIDIDGGTFTLNGTNTLTGTVTVNGGSLVVNQIVSGPAIVTSATFTSTTLTVVFSSPPTTGQEFRLLYGAFGNGVTVVLTGAGGATASFDIATSTLTIN
jgi:autotransporter-associated beta strand protein